MIDQGPGPCFSIKKSSLFLHTALLFCRFAKNRSKQYYSNKCSTLLCVNDMLDSVSVTPCVISNYRISWNKLKYDFMYLRSLELIKDTLDDI